VENYVDNPVHNKWKSWYFSCHTTPNGDIHTVICRFSERFPRFFAGKRYKLINFAPKFEIVDNCQTVQRTNKLESTIGVKSLQSQVDNQTDKDSDGKF
jgi:hypothetical protein